MTDYVSLEELRASAEKDVEIEDRRYRIRKLSLFEWMTITGVVPTAPDGEPAKARARNASKEVEVNVAPLVIVTALVAPVLSGPSDLYLIPLNDQIALMKEIGALMGITVPFDGESKSGT